MTRLSLKQMAAAFGKSPKTFAARVRREQIPFTPFGRSMLFDPIEVEAYLRAQQSEPAKVAKFSPSVRKSRVKKVCRLADAVGL